MSEGRAMLEIMVGAALARERLPSQERIRQLIEEVRGLPTCSTVDADEAESIAREFEHRVGVRMGNGAVITAADYQEWLPGARSEIEPYFWDRHQRLFAEHQFSNEVIGSIDNDTDLILGRLENPRKEGSWKRRGMVLGYVQSGKTQNYTALMCKAADAGYKIIIVIAGLHNNLRNQTQTRIDQGFVGKDSSRMLVKGQDIFVGVGNYDNSRSPVTFTNRVRDFNKDTATVLGLSLRHLREPAVFVVKKNATTLKYLIEWLKEHNTSPSMNQIESPMLLIDDEADNASINVKHSKDEISRINGQIRELLQIFSKNCYVGYTATPFANIFIDPDTDDEMKGHDLFPSHFIVSLDAPSNYFGPEKVFLTSESSERIINHIEDNDRFLPIKHTIDHQVTALPPSLIDAVRAFVVACAIRRARGQTAQHNSMLVNVSRFTRLQHQIKNLIQGKLSDIQSSVRINAGLSVEQATKDAEIGSLYCIWKSEYADTNVSWQEVQSQLHLASAPIGVVEVNAQSGGKLNYQDFEEDGLNVIAVGGFSLSRGLTLENLMVSYFLRNSIMYDTLMQMCRWFGYRPGFEDLCRVWMPEETEGWYHHIAVSIEELRNELRIMQSSGGTPEEFGLKVRNHEDTLIVTARNKLGSGEVQTINLSLAGQFKETATLLRDPASINANREAAKHLGQALDLESGLLESASLIPGQGKLIPNVPVRLITDFISRFKNHSLSPLTEGDPVRRYIDVRATSELEFWDLLIAGPNEPGPNKLSDQTLGIEINCGERTIGVLSTDDKLLIGNNRRIATGGIGRVGLTDEQIRLAEEDFGIERAHKPDHIYSYKRERPLFIIYMLGITNKRGGDLIYPEPIVAWGYILPKKTSIEEKPYSVVTNAVWRRVMFGEGNEEEEEEMRGDDE